VSKARKKRTGTRWAVEFEGGETLILAEHFSHVDHARTLYPRSKVFLVRWTEITKPQRVAGKRRKARKEKK